MNAARKPGNASRIHWMDNLRSVTIFLVVLYHVGGVYEAAGLWGWFWIIDDPTTMVWVGIMGIALDVFVMPVLFFVSGYLAPASLDGKTTGRFVRGKFRRLMLPWAVAVFTLIPLYKVIFLYSRGLPQAHWSTYFHFTNPNSQNWLWFLPVLFLFNLLYALATRGRIRWPEPRPGVAIVAGLLVALACSMAAGGTLGFRSWTLTLLLDFENERLVMYFLSFLLGALFCRRGLLAAKPAGKRLYAVVNGIAWLPLTVHIFVRLVPFIAGEGFAVTAGYRLAWWLSFYAALLCMAYLMVETFRRYFDRTGPAWAALNSASYGVYIIHVILIGVFGTLLMKLGLPVYLKYPALVLLAWGGANLLVLAWKKIRSAAPMHPAVLQAGK